MLHPISVMGRRRGDKGRVELEEDDGEAAMVVIFISNDDEEATEDLSLTIVAQAREREANRKRAEEAGLPPVAAVAPASVIDLSSSPSADHEPAPSGWKAAVEASAEGEKKKKRRRKKRKKTEAEENETPQVVASAKEEKEPLGSADLVVTEVNETSDNVVLRKLLVSLNCFVILFKFYACFSCMKNSFIPESFQCAFLTSMGRGTLILGTAIGRLAFTAVRKAMWLRIV